MTRNALTAEQVARRLGVKVETVYAYVSRGVLGRTLAGDGRTSRFDSAEVEVLARRGRPRRESERQGVVEVSLATAITGIRDERLLYRGFEASALAARSTFEAVAELLWTGVLPEQARWPVSEKAKVAVLATKGLPRDAGAIDRLCVATAALATAYPLRVDLGPAAVIEHARALLSTYPEVLPPVATARASGSLSGSRSPTFAARLFPRVSPLPVTAARVALLDATLVVLADHELATSTLAARVAASTRADPFAVVLAGLGAVSGPLHGKAALAVHRMLAEAATSSAEGAVARAVQDWRQVLGFGHAVYRGADPRAACLLERLSSVVRPGVVQLLDAVARAGAKSAGAEPNVDFALAAVAYALEMPFGATEAIFAIARTAGWIAHALEEYGERPLRFRARSIYIGATGPS